MELTVRTRALGRRRPLLEDWSLTFPPQWADGDGEITLRDLIARVVRAEVEAFRNREKKRSMVSVLSESQIEDQAQSGKVDMGGRDGGAEVGEDDAVSTALQAFEDGIYLVIIDEAECRELDKPVHLNPQSNITFIRLTFLAGA